MKNFKSRSERVWGASGSDRLAACRTVVVGLGGVGGAAAAALCRAGVENILLVDFDSVDITNLNRQILTDSTNIGRPKAQNAAQILKNINPAGNFTPANVRIGPDNAGFIADYRPDYVIDAVDAVSAKLALAVLCEQKHIPLVSSTGTGNRLDPSCLRLGDIAETAGTGCPLARIMRRELARIGIARWETVYSTEPPIKPFADPECDPNSRSHPPASAAFVPPAAGLLLASHVVRKLLGDTQIGR